MRNSGATAVCEGVGDHGCEYMTRGAVAAGCGALPCRNVPQTGCRRLGAAEKIAVALQLYAFNSLSRIPRDTTASSACRVSFFQIQEMGLLNNKRRCPIFPPGLNGGAHPTARHCYRPRPDGTELCRWHERRSGLCVGFGRDAW